MNATHKSMLRLPLLILLSLSLTPRHLLAQEAGATASRSARATIGTVSAINGNTLTLKADSGAETKITLQDSTHIVKTLPGQKDLKGATVIQLQDVQVGDRALVRGAPADGGDTVAAASIIVMKSSDVANRQQQEMQEWQRRGAGGIVKAVDPNSGTIAATSGSTQAITIQTSPTTQFLQYAPDSVKFSDAKKSSIDQIKPGDQLRARGNRSTDGTQVTADAIIFGSFRNIAGTVNSVDPSAGTLTVMDLISKRPAEVKITPDTQMRKIPPEMAQRIAFFLKRTPGGAGSEQATNAPPSAQGQGMRTGGGFGGQGGPPDFQQIIRRMPAATISDLQKGDAVMIVTTQATSGQEVTALTLLSGVEPILTAAPTQATAANLLSGWSMGGGEAESQ